VGDVHSFLPRGAICGGLVNWHKLRLGFIPSSNLQTVTQSGTYTLAPSEPPYVGIQALRIPRGLDPDGSTSYYYLDFRRDHPLFDPSYGSYETEGVAIRLAPDHDVPGPVSPLLLDTTPTADWYTYDAPLGVGRSRPLPIGPSKNVWVSTLGVSPAAATVAVSFGWPHGVAKVTSNWVPGRSRPVLRYLAARGQASDLTVSSQASDRYVVTDARVPMAAGGSCSQLDGQRADCCCGIRVVRLSLSDGDDRVTVRGPAPSVVSAGSGNDTIDVLNGVRDTVICGSGTDTVRVDSFDQVAGDCEHVSRQ
jgi:hypothetical protein